jgi:RNA polymerase sigma factor (sigma-70 family)
VGADAVTEMSGPPIWPPEHVEVHGSVTAMDPDLELLAAWRRGDQQAAGRILDGYYKLIRRTIATKIPDRDVDDLVQKVILALYEGRERFRADAKLKTYVMRVARNMIADYYRCRRPTASLDVLGSSAHELGAGPSSLLAQQEQQRLLLEALRSVSLDDQLLLELHYWEKMTGPQLAQVFECAEPTIRSRLRRAKARLRDRLDQLVEQNPELADTTTDLDTWAKQLREAIEPRLRRAQAKRS